MHAYDDWWDKDFLYYMTNQVSGVGFVYCDAMRHHENASIFLEDRVMRYPDFDQERLMRECYLNLCTVMLRRYLLLELKADDGYYFDESLVSGMDWDFWIRLLPFAEFKHIPVPLVYQRMHKARVTESVKHIRSRWKVFKRYNEPTLRDWWREYAFPRIKRVVA